MLRMRDLIYFHLCFGSGALRRRTPTNGDAIGAKFALQELPSFTLMRVMRPSGIKKDRRMLADFVDWKSRQASLMY